jgi:hypothetical protein
VQADVIVDQLNYGRYGAQARSAYGMFHQQSGTARRAQARIDRNMSTCLGERDDDL